MKKREFEDIQKSKEEYRKYTTKAIAYGSILILLFGLIFALLILYTINKESISQLKLTYITIIGIVDLILICLFLLLKGKAINICLKKASQYFQYMAISMTKQIKHKSFSNQEFITNLNLNIEKMKFNVTNSDLNNEIIFTAYKNTLLKLKSYNIIVHTIENITIDKIENIIRTVFKESIPYPKISITYIYFVSKVFDENVIEYLNSSYKLNELGNKYIIPIGIDLLTEDVYFKKVTIIYRYIIRNQINYTIYQLFNEHVEFNNRYLIYMIFRYLFYISMLSIPVYLIAIKHTFSILNLVTIGIIIFIGAIFAGISTCDLMKIRSTSNRDSNMSEDKI
ncbi:MAG TPA: hypothetical protein DEP70_03840 [Acholeplasmataceae bacterium]|nr:hypothetical protein [Acholeplasmataceae bacterium]